MELFFKTIELVGISLGAGGAFIFDAFFILSMRDHHVKHHESTALSRISLLSIIAVSVAMTSYIISIAFQLEQAVVPDIAFVGIKLALFILALTCGLALRKIHLPALLRHQRTYIHLAEHFKFHQDSLASTASYSTISWIFLISLTSASQNGGVFSSYILENPLKVIILFIIIGFIGSKLSVFLKNFLLSPTYTQLNNKLRKF